MMQKIPKRKITLEDLAGMVARGFEGVDKRFDEVDLRLDRVESRLTIVESRLDTIEGSVEDLKKEVIVINDRFVPWYSFDRLVHQIGRAHV